MAQYRWALLERDELIQRAIERMRAGMADRAANAVVGAYCIALHAACSGVEGPLRQNLAYEELAKYLYSLVCMRFADLLPNVREDVTQSALERIFKSFDRCREPVAFLAFAAQYLLDAVRVVRRQEYRVPQSLEQAIGQSEELLAEVLHDDHPHPIEHIIAGEQRIAIGQLLLEYLQAHPRAAQQVAVLRMEWLDDLDEDEISKRLGISINSVYVARSRIVKTLRSEPRWRARATALGIHLDEL
jgi:RNA polymerase sigma factor (sigma-70 family)